MVKLLLIAVEFNVRIDELETRAFSAVDRVRSSFAIRKVRKTIDTINSET